MLTSKFLLLVVVLPFLSTAQDTLDLQLKRAIKTISYECATSADVCKTRIFRTRQPGMFYKINYDVNGRIHSKGAAMKEGMETARKGKHKIEYFEVGIWRYYNYDKNELR
jgi:hypothetical protein